MTVHGRDDATTDGGAPSSPNGAPLSLEAEETNETEALLTRDEILALIRREVGRDVGGKDEMDEEECRPMIGGVEEAVGAEKSAGGVNDGKDAGKLDVESKDAEAAAAPKIGKLLPKDVYSFLAFAPVLSPAFFVALSCHLVQMFSLVVVTMDQFYAGNNSEENRLGVPSYVTVPVRACQFFALIIAVACEPDPLQSINLYFRGFNREHFLHYFPDLPKHMKWRWILSAFARLIEGLFCLATMFMLIMRSSTGKDVLLSFKAIIFISGLDNAVYGLSSWGYFGEGVRKAAKHDVIGDVDFSQVAESKRCNLRLWRSLTVASMFLVLMSFWAFIAHQQLSRAYLPSHLYVQLGDDEVPALGLLSDVYDLEVTFTDVSWVARRRTGTGNINKRFRYCLTDKAWILDVSRDDDTAASSYGSCDEFIVKSPSTRSFNILSVAGLGWEVHQDLSRAGHVSLSIVRMVKRTEHCPPGSFGPRCEFSEPCETLSVEEENAFRLGGEFAIYGIGEGEVQDKFTRNFIARAPIETGEKTTYRLLTDESGGPVLTMYQYPIYYSPIDLSGMTSGVVGTVKEFVAYEVIVCVGRRWARAILGMSKQSSEVVERNLGERIKILEQLFKHVELGHRSAFRYVTHLSEPFDVNTLEDIGMPTGLQFFAISDREFKATAGNDAPVTLICSCPICLMVAELLEKPFTVTYQTSPFFGQNTTCADIMEISSKHAKGSLKCNALRMESMFECGCPYQLPEEQECPLCPDGSQVDDSLVESIPFPGDGPYGGASCGELSYGINFPGGWSRGNDYYCPSMQMTYGSECGCSGVPPAPCEVVCPTDGQVFLTRKVVDVFEPNESWSGWHCGEMRGFLSGQKDEYCTTVMTTALADLCCAPPDKSAK